MKISQKIAFSNRKKAMTPFFRKMGLLIQTINYKKLNAKYILNNI